MLIDLNTWECVAYKYQVITVLTLPFLGSPSTWYTCCIVCPCTFYDYCIYNILHQATVIYKAIHTLLKSE